MYISTYKKHKYLKVKDSKMFGIGKREKNGVSTTELPKPDDGDITTETLAVKDGEVTKWRRRVAGALAVAAVAGFATGFLSVKATEQARINSPQAESSISFATGDGQAPETGDITGLGAGVGLYPVVEVGDKKVYLPGVSGEVTRAGKPKTEEIVISREAHHGTEIIKSEFFIPMLDAIEYSADKDAGGVTYAGKQSMIDVMNKTTALIDAGYDVTIEVQGETSPEARSESEDPADIARTIPGLIDEKNIELADFQRDKSLESFRSLLSASFSPTDIARIEASITSLPSVENQDGELSKAIDSASKSIGLTPVELLNYIKLAQEQGTNDQLSPELQAIQDRLEPLRGVSYTMTATRQHSYVDTKTGTTITYPETTSKTVLVPAILAALMALYAAQKLLSKNPPTTPKPPLPIAPPKPPLPIAPPRPKKPLIPYKTTIPFIDQAPRPLVPITPDEVPITPDNSPAFRRGDNMQGGPTRQGHGWKPERIEQPAFPNNGGRGSRGNKD